MTYRRKDVAGETDTALRHRWAVLGARGAVQCVFTEYLPGSRMYDVFAEFKNSTRTSDGHIWDGMDVGYHSPRPMYEDHKPMGACDLLEGDCWYDGSGLAAMRLLSEVMVNGEIIDDMIYEHLERYYVQTFG